MEWDNGATIGYNAAGYSYENYEPSTSDVACLNYPDSNITNVVFLLSKSNPEFAVPGYYACFNKCQIHTFFYIQF